MSLLGCGSGGFEAAPTTLTQRELPPDVIHDLEQQRIADCMAHEGFAYEKIPWIDYGPRRFRNTFLLTSVDVYGYGRTFAALALVTNPNGAPPDNMPANQVPAYTNTLNGPGFDFTEGDVGGCRAEGLELRREYDNTGMFSTLTASGRENVGRWLA